MPATLALIILLAATPTPASVHVTANDLVGTWNIIRGDSTGEHKLSGNGEYLVYRFPGAGGTGKWFLRGGNQIVIPSGSKKFPDEIIFIDRVEPHSDRTFLYVHYGNGPREKWMK
jgi:hypothetical protein